MRLITVLLLGLAWTNEASAEPFVPGQDHFNFTYEFSVPPLEARDRAEIWLPLASSDAFQTLQRQISAPGLSPQIARDTAFHNEVLHLSVGPADAKKKVLVSYEVTRLEQGEYAMDPQASTSLFLRSERLVPRSERFRALATAVTRGKVSTRDKAKAIYNYVFREMKYDKSGSGWGRGDAVYACDVKTGNCTDFHALFIALARSIGIPASFAIGFTIPAEGTAGKITGYHCWADVLIDGTWLPLDISEAAKAPLLKDYYFGHHPANRLQMSQGRDLRLQPAPLAGPVNFLVHPYVEINGKAVNGISGTYTFARAQQPQVRS